MSTKSPIGDKTEVELLREQVEALTKLVMASQQNESKPKKERAVRPARKEKSDEIRPDTYITIMSLVPNPLNLSTRPPNKGGQTFRFENYGVTKKVLYSQLLEIIENHPNFFEKGYFYILDREVIEKNNYIELYNKLLTKEMMDSVINNDPNAVKIFESANEGQKNIMIEKFVTQIVDGQSIDFNLINNINRASGKDIQKMAAERKEALSYLDNKSENK